jgi:hypothetical protein
MAFLLFLLMMNNKSNSPVRYCLVFILVEVNWLHTQADRFELLPQLVEPSTRVLAHSLSTNTKKPPFGGSFVFGGERGINQKRLSVFAPSGFADKPLVSSC